MPVYSDEQGENIRAIVKRAGLCYEHRKTRLFPFLFSYYNSFFVSVTCFSDKFSFFNHLEGKSGNSFETLKDRSQKEVQSSAKRETRALCSKRPDYFH